MGRVRAGVSNQEPKPRVTLDGRSWSKQGIRDGGVQGRGKRNKVVQAH